MGKYSELREILDKESIKYNESMKNHTTVKVGGKVDVLVTPTSISELTEVLKFVKMNSIPIYVIGNGSNLLVTDEDINCMVIKLSSKFSDIKVEGEYIECLAGSSMPKVSLIARQNNLSGFEFACGIPGTIGGGIKMNAGAYGSQMSEICDEVTYLDENLNLVTIKKDKLEFGYRHSIFIDNPKHIIVKAKFRLSIGVKEEIEAKCKENTISRTTKQPLEYPNFGSVFKRPEGYFVGKLVIDSGLQGVKIGGAQVSTKHAGFIVNVDNATCKDILNLTKLIQDTVFEKFKVKLETEVEIIGGKS